MLNLVKFLQFPVSPEIFLLIATCVVLLVDLFVPQKTKLLSYILSQLTIIIVFCLTVYIYQRGVVGTSYLFEGDFLVSNAAFLMKSVILVISFFSFMYARAYIEQLEISQGDYYLLALFSILGMMVLISAANLLIAYLGIELLSLPLYTMIALQRNSAVRAEAAMKYFILGAIASALLLYGLGLVYVSCESLSFINIAQTASLITGWHLFIFTLSIIFILAGVGFKLGLAPFHNWVPDVYEGAPTSVGLFLSSAPKIAVVAFLITLLMESFRQFYIHLEWQEILIVIALISFSLGNLVAIVQKNIKRMLGYSSIAHMGYVCLGLIAQTSLGYAASAFYVIVYAGMSMGAFGFLLVLSSRGIEIETFDDLRGLNARNPWLAFMMLIIMFSMAGIPPTGGFFAKIGLLQALINIHLIWLASLAILFAVIGAYYYLNVVKIMYFEEPINPSKFHTTLDARIAISLNGLLLLGLGLFPSSLIQLCQQAF